ncbi:MAG TPA: hypothetical protein VFM49_31930 [Chloroflexia bacterium]|jgi:hypothetical protein|nr:hypothetical protein [Chloroflexia bacterium]
MSSTSIYQLEQQMHDTTKQIAAELDHIRYAGQARHGDQRPAARTLWQIGRLRFVWAPR